MSMDSCFEITFGGVGVGGVLHVIVNFQKKLVAVMRAFSTTTVLSLSPFSFLSPFLPPSPFCFSRMDIQV